MANLAARLLRAALTHPQTPVIVTPTKITTYAELSDRVSRLRGGLVRAGVAPGDRIAILVGGPDFIEAYLAILGVGAVAVPLNLMSPGAELARSLVRTEAGVAIAEGATSAVAEGVGAEVLTVAELLIAESKPETLDVDDDSPAVLLMTSGTTGDPRAAVLTHGNLKANLDQLHAHPGLRAHPGDVGLAILPFFHIFGLNVLLGYSLYSGTTLAFSGQHGADAWLEAIGEFKVTVLLATPQVFDAWSRLAQDSRVLDSVRLAVSGAAPLDKQAHERFMDTFGKPLWEGYGLTEASPVVSTNCMDPEPTPGSVGRPLPGIDVELRSSDGELTLVGDPGEVWVKGANVFAGYWKDEAATAEMLQDGWLRTGDIAVTDDQGRLYLVDRARDIIIVSGFNVFPAEVEEMLVSHPGVKEAAVVGRESERTGEEIVAYVVSEDERIDTDTLRNFCFERISRYKVPTEIIFTDRLPHTFVGKVRRGVLREAESD